MIGHRKRIGEGESALWAAARPEPVEVDPGAGGGARAAARYARVALARGIDRAAEDSLTYSCGGAAVPVGAIVEVPLGKSERAAWGVVVRVGGAELLGDLPAGRVKPLKRDSGMRLPGALLRLGEWLSEYYVCPLGVTLAAMVPAMVRRAGRVARGPARSGATGGEQEPSGEPGGSGMARPDLTPAQRAIVEGIGASLGRFGVHVLHGVTGSGKTEVYLRLIERVTGAGGSAIVLVPEIALTPQTVRRFRERFEGGGVRLAVLHSGLTPAQRRDAWLAAAEAGASGRACVAIGARSALFAPIERPGLIVVDEEHDASYKQDSAPRYHARDAAVVRAKQADCPIVLGSATPSLETWLNAAGPGLDGAEAAGGPHGAGRSRKYTLWELEERVGGGRLPTVEVVALRAREEDERADGVGAPPIPRAAAGPSSTIESIGPRLARALRETLDAGGQAMLLLNRRGYAGYVCCTARGCPWALTCEHCDATMVVHRAGRVPRAGSREGRVRCHHCLAAAVLPDRCPVCGSRTASVGAGTQRVEEELERRFGASHGLVEGRTLRRIDSDTMRSGRDYAAALDEFASGRVRVLLGTQMIAKGLDFPNVRLVGVINADTSLSMPDFRCSERTFQLVSQVAGRAGRGEHAGVVIVQTMNPDAAAIRHAAGHDYRGFAAEELGARRAAGLPPFSRLARVVVREREAGRARRRAAELAEALRREAGPRCRVDGPMACVLSRVAGRYREGIELWAPSAAELHRPLAALRARGLLTSDERTAVDVDPTNLL